MNSTRYQLSREEKIKVMRIKEGRKTRLYVDGNWQSVLLIEPTKQARKNIKNA